MEIGLRPDLEVDCRELTAIYVLNLLYPKRQLSCDDTHALAVLFITQDISCPSLCAQILNE